jgi:small subunit ribosomal protein S18
MAPKPQRTRRAAQPGVRSAKRNLLAGLGLSVVDYKDTAALRVFIQQQRQVSTAIKNAREMALLPYPGPIAGTTR